MKFNFRRLIKPPTSDKTIWVDTIVPELVTDIPKVLPKKLHPPFDLDQYQMDRVTEKIHNARKEGYTSTGLNEEQLRPRVEAILNKLGYKTEWIAMRDEAGTIISW